MITKYSVPPSSPNLQVNMNVDDQGEVEGG